MLDNRYAKDVTIPFKKSQYYGNLLADCPVEYLDWLLSQDWVWQNFKDKILEHLESRPEWHRMDDE